MDNGDKEIKTYDNGSAPFVMAGKFDYKITDSVTAGLRALYRDFWGTSGNTELEFYPNASWTFAEEMMSVSGGIKLGVKNTSGTTATTFGVPLVFELKLKH